jgi:hypothetical protein
MLKNPVATHSLLLPPLPLLCGACPLSLSILWLF